MRVFSDAYVFVCVLVPLGFEGGMWNLIVLIPDLLISDHCLSIYFTVFLRL